MIPQRWMEKHKIVISISCVIGLAAGIVPLGNEFAFQRTCAFLPFFVLGFYSHKYGWIDKMRTLALPIVLGVLAVSTCLFVLCINRDIQTMELFYENTPYRNLQDCLYRLLIWIMAIGNAIMFVKMIRPAPITAFLGSLTLYIFVYHQFVIELIMKVAGYLSIPQNVAIIVLESVVVTGMCCIAARIPLLRNIVNPITSLIKRK